MLGICLLAEDLLASQEGPCSMKFVHGVSFEQRKKKKTLDGEVEEEHSEYRRQIVEV
jgi:hypothetical protein